MDNTYLFLFFLVGLFVDADASSDEADAAVDAAVDVDADVAVDVRPWTWTRPWTWPRTPWTWPWTWAWPRTRTSRSKSATLLLTYSAANDLFRSVCFTIVLFFVNFRNSPGRTKRRCAALHSALCRSLFGPVPTFLN